MEMSPVGILKLWFNKPIIKPPIKEESRLLKAQTYYSIGEVIELSVISDNAEPDTPTNFYSIDRY